jgi:two-component sensor histidine kinase
MPVEGAPAVEACDDPARLEALRRYEILDTAREPAFDSIVELAARICRAPMAVINLVEERRQWFKSEVGLGVRETPLEVSICRHFLLAPGLNVVPDLRDDRRLAGNPLVTGEPGLRFYAGCLLRTAEGHGIGTLCVLDREPRPGGLDADQRFALHTLAGQVMAQLDLRLALRQREELLAQRDLLMRELNHRVKNNLQLVTSIVALRRRSVRDPEGRAALDDVRQRILGIASVHEHLYRADEEGAADGGIELARYLGGLVDQIRRSTGAAVGLELGPGTAARIPEEWAIPLALIVNELVTNALKHAYPQGAPGPVRVALAASGDGRRAITVADEGRGLPPGFDPLAARDTLGMRLLNALAAQIGARLSLGGSEGPGTRLTVALPASPADGDPRRPAGTAG